MNYTFAREILRQCRTANGVGSLRVWQPEFDRQFNLWRGSMDAMDDDAANLATKPLRPGDRLERRINRQQDTQFTNQWRDWIKAQ